MHIFLLSIASVVSHIFISWEKFLSLASREFVEGEKSSYDKGRFS